MNATEDAEDRRSSLLRIVGVAVVVMAVLSTAGVTYQSWQLNKQTQRLDRVISCQTAYIAEFRGSVAARATAQQEQIDTQRRQLAAEKAQVAAQRTLLQTTLRRDDAASVAAIRAHVATLDTYDAALTEYDAALLRLIQARDQHPLAGTACQ